ncbi:hypothetical protein GCM10010302_47090 [Streptomyces polychromogenes]|uniref:Uncharacterized protein n=1 Tax=Streptomyces polychromogenes TaxID=67342 RepID=A0ABN0VHS8_9ACTN
MDTYRVAGGALTVAAGAIVAAAFAAAHYDRPGGPALAADLYHPVLLAALAALALTGAALLSSRRPGLRKGAALGLAGAAVLGVAAVPAYSVATDPFPDQEWDVPAPDGSGRRLVVERGVGLGDPAWSVHIVTGTFPTARRWPVATYTPGHPRGVLGATWRDPSHIRLIDLDHTHHDLRIAPNGRPLDGLDW